MPEHTPAPMHSRSIYGFVLYLMSKTFLCIYLAWAFLPDSWLNYLGIYYYPQKYWAVAIPILFLVALTLFAFFIYPSLNLMMTPEPGHNFAVTDSFTLKQLKKHKVEKEGSFCDCYDKSKCHKYNNPENDEDNSAFSIPPAVDLDLEMVYECLYLDKELD